MGATNYPNILLWCNNVFIKIDMLVYCDRNVCPKYLQASISGYILHGIQLTLEEVINYTNRECVEVEDFAALGDIWKKGS